MDIDLLQTEKLALVFVHDKSYKMLKLLVNSGKRPNVKYAFVLLSDFASELYLIVIASSCCIAKIKELSATTVAYALPK